MFYIFETQNRPDGIVNILEPVVRQTANSGLSYYYDRKSKAVMSELFTHVSLLITDEHLHVIEQCSVNTMYHEETEE